MTHRTGTAVTTSSAPGHAGHPASLALPASSATDRVLVVLIENGGIDLGLPDLVDKLVDGIPGASAVIRDELKARMVKRAARLARGPPTTCLESAELALNRYTAAKPDTYGDVVVLRDATATFGDLKSTLIASHGRARSSTS